MAYIYDLTDTWNAGGTTFNAVKMNVTDSASASGSKLVTLQTNGTEHFSVTKAGVGYFSGNVGIGISSPSSKLHVVGATTSLAQFTGPEYAQVRHSDGTRTMYTQVYDNLGVLGTESSTPLAFATANVEKMRITAAGNVGIGTTSPGAPLEVYSTFDEILRISSVGNPYASWYAGGTRRGYIQAQSSAFTVASDTAIPLILATNTAERMRIDSSGNVGIGTSSPISGAGLTVGNDGNSGATTKLSFSTNTTERAFISMQGGTGEMRYAAGFSGYGGFSTFYTNGTERARIDSSGNLLVGTTSLVQSSKVSIDSGGGPSIGSKVNTTSAVGHIIFENPNGAVGQIFTNGSATTYSTSSDARLKHDVIDAPEASSLIDAIKVRSFKWNADSSEQRYGFIAQELLPIAPEAVSQPADPEEMMGVDYSKLVPILVKELQSLRTRVAQLEGNI